MELGVISPGFQVECTEFRNLCLILPESCCVNLVNFQSRNPIVTFLEVIQNYTIGRIIEIQQLPGNPDLYGIFPEAVVCVGIIFRAFRICVAGNQVTCIVLSPLISHGGSDIAGSPLNDPEGRRILLRNIIAQTVVDLIHHVDIRFVVAAKGRKAQAVIIGMHLQQAIQLVRNGNDKICDAEIRFLCLFQYKTGPRHRF